MLGSGIQHTPGTQGRTEKEEAMLTELRVEH